MRSLNPNNKVGVKHLSDEQFRDVFSNKQLLSEKIGEIRKTAEEINKKREETQIDNFNLMFDNIISILGSRGTGKTSVLYTLYNELKSAESPDDYDIVIPMIIPELLGEQDTLIGWILTSLERKVWEIEQEDITHRKKYNDFNNCVLNTKKTLRDKYNDLKAEYAASMHSRKNSSYYTYTEELRIDENRIDESYNFMNNLCGFWDNLIEYRKCIYKGRHKIDVEPLIFIFIDDSDLAPHVLIELMYLLPKYMSHPNVVVLVSASPRVMHLALKNRLYKNMLYEGLSLYTNNTNVDEVSRRATNQFMQEKGIDFSRDYKIINSLTTDILLKAFPPSNRFYLQEYKTLERKMNMYISTDDGKEQKICELFVDEVAKIEKYTGFEKRKECIQNLFERFPKMYFSFLGKTSREISNGYFALRMLSYQLKCFLKERVTTEQYNEREYNKIFVTLRSFLQTIIDSNPIFQCFCSKVDNLFFEKYGNWELYLNYAEINNVFLSAQHFMENKTKNINLFLSMYALLNFIENIIVMIVPSREKTHGYAELSELFDRCGYGHVIPFGRNAYKVITNLEVFYDSHLISEFDASSLTHQNLFLSIVSNDLMVELKTEEKTINSSMLRRNLRKIETYILGKMRYDSEWGELLCNILFNRFSGNWVFHNLSAEDFLIESEYIDDILSEVNTSLGKNLYNIIINNNDYIKWVKDNKDSSFEYIRETKKIDELFHFVENHEYNDFWVIELSEIQKVLEKKLSSNRDQIIAEWISKYVIQENMFDMDIKSIFDKLKEFIYSYNRVEKDRKKDSYYKSDFLINDYNKFYNSLDFLRGISYSIDSEIFRLCNELELNEDCGKVINRNEFMSFYQFVYDSLDEIRIRNNSRQMSRAINELKNILANCKRCVVDPLSYMNETINYLMALKSITYIHDKYIAAVLYETIKIDKIHRVDENIILMQNIYNTLLSVDSNSTTLKNKLVNITLERKRELYKKLINAENDEVYI